MTYKNAKTILFAGLIAAMILPFSGMNFAEAETVTHEELKKMQRANEVPSNVTYTQVIPTVSDETQELLDKLEKIAIALHNTTSESEVAKLRAELDTFKPEMIKHGLTPSFEFGEDRAEWTKKLSDYTHQRLMLTSESDWNVKHNLTWGCTSWYYCDAVWSEWIDLNDWSAITVTMPTVYQSYSLLTHDVANMSGSTQTQTMNDYGVHLQGSTILQNNYHSSIQFWLPNEVESDSILATWSTQTGDQFFSTIRIT